MLQNPFTSEKQETGANPVIDISSSNPTQPVTGSVGGESGGESPTGIRGILGAFKRKRGRPPGSGKKNQEVDPSAAKVSAAEKMVGLKATVPTVSDKTGPEPAKAELPDPGVIRDTMAALLEIADAAIRDSVHSSALSITGQDSIAKTYEQRVAMKPIESKTISKLTETVCVQYKLAGEHLPAFCLLSMLTGYVGRSVFVVRELKKLALQKQTAEKQVKTEKTKTDESGA